MPLEVRGEHGDSAVFDLKTSDVLLEVTEWCFLLPFSCLGEVRKIKKVEFLINKSLEKQAIVLNPCNYKAAGGISEETLLFPCLFLTIQDFPGVCMDVKTPRCRNHNTGSG